MKRVYYHVGQGRQVFKTRGPGLAYVAERIVMRILVAIIVAAGIVTVWRVFG